MFLVRRRFMKDLHDNVARRLLRETVTADAVAVEAVLRVDA